MADYRFNFRRIASDREGYYYDRWDRAVPLSVVAESETDARQEARKVSGEPPSGRFWKFHLDSIDAVLADQIDAELGGE